MHLKCMALFPIAFVILVSYMWITDVKIIHFKDSNFQMTDDWWMEDMTDNGRFNWPTDWLIDKQTNLNQLTDWTNIGLTSWLTGWQIDQVTD